GLIAEEVRGWAPPMTSAFAAALDDAVARGFAAAPQKPRPWPAWLRWMPAAGVAGAILIALLVALSTHGGGSGSNSPSSGVKAAPTAAAREAAPAQAAPAPEADLT